MLVATRSLEAMARCLLSQQVPWGGDAYTYNTTRMKRLLAEGVDVRSPEALAMLGFAEYLSDLEVCVFCVVSCTVSHIFTFRS